MNLAWMWEVCQREQVTLVYSESVHQAADMFTKGFTDAASWQHAQSLINVGSLCAFCPPPPPAQGRGGGSCAPPAAPAFHDANLFCIRLVKDGADATYTDLRSADMDGPGPCADEARWQHKGKHTLLGGTDAADIDKLMRVLMFARNSCSESTRYNEGVAQGQALVCRICPFPRTLSSQDACHRTSRLSLPAQPVRLSRESPAASPSR